jgi:hypothetical protein
MRFQFAALAVVLVMGRAVIPAVAASQMFATEAAATQTCGADEVVWVNLDNGRFYHKNQAAYAKGNNGGYACMKAAHSQYREAHD